MYPRDKSTTKERIKALKVAFRADGGPDIGMGHIMRCSALASEMQKQGIEISFITRSNISVNKIMRTKGFQIIEINQIPKEKEAQTVKEIIKNHDINIVVTDSYSIDQNYLVQVGKGVDVLVTIDDLNEMPFPSDIVINGNVYAPKLEYRSTAQNTVFLLGSKYVLLREGFSDLGKRKLNTEVREVLVTVGGSDPLNLTPKILQGLGQVNFEFKINAVLGPGFQNGQLVKKTAEYIGKPVNLFHNVEDMAALMLRCDLAVTAGGSTLYELARTGTPTVTVLQADNQIPGAETMNEMGAVLNLGMGSEVTQFEITSVVSELCESFELRQKMSKKGQALVDGHGCRRCACKILEKFLKKKGVGF